jgi:membrane-bound lytic murein transglycosylase C
MRPSMAVLAATAAVLSGCETARMATDIALSKNPQAALKETARQKGETYARNPQAVVRDLGTLKRDYDRVVELLSGNVKQEWGKKEVKLPTRTHYVKYTQNYRSRAQVDFDTGEILVETVDESDPRASLRNAIVTTLLTPDDPRAVDLFSDSAVTLTGDRPPYLLGLVVDPRGNPVRTPAEAEAFADHLLRDRAATREVELEAGRKSALFVRIAMVANFSSKQAEKYRSAVTRFALQYKVSPTLVFAIIKTESNFNPFAVSPAPAYGMMQLVPTSGGREANRRARGVDEAPSPQSLFDADHNIELGSAYLAVLGQDQLERVANPVAREYCVIAAYNTGPGNVLKSFSRDRVAAFNAINSLQPPGVFERLRAQLPYEETRQYLVKVVNARKQFVSRAGET